MATFPCQLCGKTFLTLEKFTIHNYSHSRERPYKCLQTDCGKAFVSRYKLMRHMATHSPQKSHQCAHCEKTFNRKDHLKNHLQTHDPNKMPPAALLPAAAPSPPGRDPKYGAGSTSFPALASLPPKADVKGFGGGLFEDLPLPAPQSPHKPGPGFELPRAGPGRGSAKEPPADAVNLALPASLDLSSLLSFWQLPPPAAQGAFGGPLGLGPAEPLPHRLGCLGQQQQEPPLAVGPVGAVGLGQLPLPPIPHVFTAGTCTAILPHFHHAFR
ncbi:zinc finger protein PLAGL1 [Octodon degus]|uniref:Zinc finger protein PLAGL1 n=1 Tax=Octodon degus TaxID=10160 RepID=A0A6P6E6M2_OCTDE|nr:zinc finger protein PLAGL1 [Octodon degus]